MPRWGNSPSSRIARRYRVRFLHSPGRVRTMYISPRGTFVNVPYDAQRTFPTMHDGRSPRCTTDVPHDARRTFISVGAGIAGRDPGSALGLCAALGFIRVFAFFVWVFTPVDLGFLTFFVWVFMRFHPGFHAFSFAFFSSSPRQRRIMQAPVLKKGGSAPLKILIIYDIMRTSLKLQARRVGQQERDDGTTGIYDLLR